MLFRGTIAIAILAISAANKTYANDIDVQFSGFASLTLSYTDDSDIGFASSYSNVNESGFSATRDSILGGQANISLSKNWDSVFQVVIQDHAFKSFDNFLELAFVRYRPTRHWAIRAGRLNSDLYLLSEYPYVGYAYLWVRPPHSYYSFANIAGNFDGVDVEYSKAINDGFLRLKLAYGSTTAKLQAYNDDFFIDFDNLTTFSATYSLDAWTMRFSLSKSDFGDYKLTSLDEYLAALNSIPQSIWPQAQKISNKFNTKGNSIEYAAFGLTYDHNNWLIQSEMGISESDWIVAPSVLSGYISAGYRVDNAIFYTGFTAAKHRHDVIKVNDPAFPPSTPEQFSVPIQQLAVASQSAVKVTNVHQHSINVGVKWQLSERIALKAQLDRFDIKPQGAGLWSLSNPTDVDKGHKVHMLSLNASMVF
ncbi:hypothetical protein H5085_01795 [Pseudoalteromonas sp. SR43-6]|uniref:hypothetical protein n=1 Tax=unclassified Pseudoalteromonas TaxID=194690 RepID=UPI0015FC3BA6|nr:MULTISPECIES: hypothetical protein [unclassified Pseudoalteromonas]MBB1287794.1 hypothetical protein [Pseudoalteromonas sp. SR41-5]MBB1373076.1 hypothetical protein [Pseudoalteromonas sp. SR43-6]MBB1378478.1 hypothetical protein [Pseudoalteromonas sp. SR43-2]MBB1412435.1 hypothetical protein [Pseudoalteromonas sp. SG43-8]